MTRFPQLATAALLIAAVSPMYASSKPKNEKAHENVEWLWQYTSDAAHPDGRENDLVQDLRFKPLLEQYLTAPQTFWGPAVGGKYRSLADTALDYFSEPDKVIADQNRYISISGCVVHFCPARGLLWVDLNGKHHLVVFAAIDWTKQGRPTTDPTAEYSLYVFPNESLSAEGPGSGPGQQMPDPLKHAIGRWAAEPLAGSGIVQHITHAFVVDPDGTEHEVAPSAVGVQPPPTPKSDDDQAAPLKPRS